MLSRRDGGAFQPCFVAPAAPEPARRPTKTPLAARPLPAPVAGLLPAAEAWQHRPNRTGR